MTSFTDVYSFPGKFPSDLTNTDVGHLPQDKEKLVAVSIIIIWSGEILVHFILVHYNNLDNTFEIWIEAKKLELVNPIGDELFPPNFIVFEKVKDGKFRAFFQLLIIENCLWTFTLTFISLVFQWNPGELLYET